MPVPETPPSPADPNDSFPTKGRNSGTTEGWRAPLRSHINLTALLLLMAASVGSASALFLWSLDAVTAIRFRFPWLVYLLPLAGVGIGALYHRWGKTSDAGNNLIMDQIHEPGGGVPRRMAPFVLIGTLATHLFGGSAGREGTAVQMGGSIASAWCSAFRLEKAHVRIMLMSGVAAGFGAVFGTPLAGAAFAVEVLIIGRLQRGAILPCLLAAIIGDWICTVWGAEHTRYAIAYQSSSGSAADTHFFEPVLFAKVVVTAIACGMVSRGFAETCHSCSALIRRWIPHPPLRPAFGGFVVILLYVLAQTPDYLGLGVWSPDPNAVTLHSFFSSPEIHPWSWLWKTAFTVATLSAGFKGGEVTPLFFIGAALGNAAAGLLQAPPDLFAGVGLVAIFAGATNTPIACTLLGIELFGTECSVYFAGACFIAYLCSGHSGIYLSQRVGVSKSVTGTIPPGTTLREVRERAGSRAEPPAGKKPPQEPPQ